MQRKSDILTVIEASRGSKHIRMTHRRLLSVKERGRGEEERIQSIDKKNRSQGKTQRKSRKWGESRTISEKGGKVGHKERYR